MYVRVKGERVGRVKDVLLKDKKIIKLKKLLWIQNAHMQYIHTLQRRINKEVSRMSHAIHTVEKGHDDIRERYAIYRHVIQVSFTPKMHSEPWFSEPNCETNTQRNIANRILPVWQV